MTVNCKWCTLISVQRSDTARLSNTLNSTLISGKCATMIIVSRNPAYVTATCQISTKNGKGKCKNRATFTVFNSNKSVLCCGLHLERAKEVVNHA